jgi:hypothetical protein
MNCQRLQRSRSVFPWVSIATEYLSTFAQLAGVASFVLVWEDLTTKVKNRQRAWNPNSLAGSNDRQVPTTDQSKKAKPTSDLQQCRDVFSVRFSCSGSN